MLGRSLGLDLGSHAIKVVELRQTLRGIELVRLQEFAVGTAVQQPQTRAPEPAPGADPAGGDAGPGAPPPFSPEQLQTLREWAAGVGLASERVVCAIPGDRATRRRMQLPFRDRRRIAQAVPFEVEGETPFDLEAVFVDWELGLTGPSGAEVVATVVPRTEVGARLAALAEVGIVPRILEVEGLVLANLAEWVELPGARLLVDLGHRKTTLTLLVDTIPRASRTIPVGGRHLTEAIARERGVSFQEAERIKLRDGVLPQPGAGGSAAGVRVLDRLARDLVRTIGGLEAVLGASPEKSLEGLVLVGGGARLARLDQYLSERTGVPAARLTVPPGSPAGALLAAGDPARFAPALALALRGTLKARTRTNFLQAEFAPRLDLSGLGRRLRTTAMLLGAVLLLAAGATANRIVLQSRRADAVQAALARIWQEAVPGRPVPDDVPRALQDRLRDVRTRADLLGIYGGNLSALDLLTEISKLVPADLAVVFEELSIDGQVVRIRGHTPTYAAVDQLKAALARFPSFGDIRVSEIQSDAQRGGNNFSVTISLAKPGATP
jgi:general secretion pathway protein L